MSARCIHRAPTEESVRISSTITAAIAPTVREETSTIKANLH